MQAKSTKDSGLQNRMAIPVRGSTTNIRRVLLTSLVLKIKKKKILQKGGIWRVQ